MKYVYLILNWIFGLIFLLVGFAIMFGNSFLQGLPLIMASFLLFPPSRKFAYEKIKIELSENVRIGFIVALCIGAFVISGIEKEKAENHQALLQQKAQAEKIAKIIKQKKEYFKANKEQIISSLNRNYLAKKYKLVIDESNKYLISKDEELKSINSKAKVELAKIKKAEKIRLAKIEKEKK